MLGLFGYRVLAAAWPLCILLVYYDYDMLGCGDSSERCHAPGGSGVFQQGWFDQLGF